MLTFQTSTSEVWNAGNYPVWVSNYGSVSDTLFFSTVDVFPQPITPIVECVRNNGGGSYTAFFGYNNGNNVSVLLPKGYTYNSFSPNPINRE